MDDSDRLDRMPCKAADRAPSPDAAASWKPLEALTMQLPGGVTPSSPPS